MNEHPATLAKLTRPHLAGILPRERLFNDLDQGREKSIVWIAGPPGSGKTTLVADYLDTWAPECVWYQVDPGDADVATFFYYMSQALPDFDKRQSALPLFSPEFQNNLSTFTRLYFRELFARLTPPFALVFDNYQEVPDQSRLHEVLRAGLEEIPAGGCVIIISRRDPPTSIRSSALYRSTTNRPKPQERTTLSNGPVRSPAGRSVARTPFRPGNVTDATIVGHQSR